MTRPVLLRPDRARAIERPFAWVPFRLLRSGLLGEIGTPQAKLLYLFLCLVADRDGVSFWGDRRISELLCLESLLLELARAHLCSLDLIAFENGVTQVLSLPSRPAPHVPTRRRTVGNEHRRCGTLAPISRVLGEIVGQE